MERSHYQDGIIKRYYENRDNIMWQKLSELVTDLYLAEGKKRVQLWKRVASAMENLKISPERIAFYIEKDDPALLAKYIEKKGI